MQRWGRSHSSPQWLLFLGTFTSVTFSNKRLESSIFTYNWTNGGTNNLFAQLEINLKYSINLEGPHSPQAPSWGQRTWTLTVAMSVLFLDTCYKNLNISQVSSLDVNMCVTSGVRQTSHQHKHTQTIRNMNNISPDVQQSRNWKIVSYLYVEVTEMISYRSSLTCFERALNFLSLTIPYVTSFRYSRCYLPCTLC